MRKINNEKEYEVVSKRIDVLLEVVTDENWGCPESIELDILSSLMEEYEKEHYPILPPSLVETLKLRMAEMGLNQKQAAKLLGVSESRMSEYLSGKNPTFEVARRMRLKMDIEPEIILQVSPVQKKQAEFA